MNKETRIWIVLGIIAAGVVAVLVVSGRQSRPVPPAPTPAVVPVASVAAEPDSHRPVVARDSQEPAGPPQGALADRPPVLATGGRAPDAGGRPPARRTSGQALEVNLLESVTVVLSDADQAEALARSLLTSSNAEDRIRGVAILAELGVLQASQLQRIAQEEAFFVPLSVLGWLNDGGHIALRDELIRLMGAAGHGFDEFTGALRSDNVGPAARRAILDHLANTLPDEAVQSILQSAALDAGLEYDVRLMAATLLATTMSTEEYLSVLQGLRLASSLEAGRGGRGGPGQDEAGDAKDDAPQHDPILEDPAWSRGISRLMEKNQAPPGMNEGAPPITIYSVQEALAAAQPTTLTELATELGHAVELAGLRVQTGATAELESRLLQYEENARSLSPAEETSLRRVRGYLDRLRAIESATGSSVVVDTPPF